MRSISVKKCRLNPETQFFHSGVFQQSLKGTSGNPATDGRQEISWKKAASPKRYENVPAGCGPFIVWPLLRVDACGIHLRSDYQTENDRSPPSPGFRRCP